MESIERYIWHLSQTYNLKGERIGIGSWERARTPVNTNWNRLGNAVLGSFEVAGGSIGLTASVALTAATFVETGGASALAGVPIALLSYNMLQKGLLRVSEGGIWIPAIPYFPFPY